jgi:hypothetical protein
MSRELIEFSNLIDEQFEPDTTITDELWRTIQSWFTTPPLKQKSAAHPVQTTPVEKIRVVA